jgi:small subunit ribosomal protein S1
MTRTEPSLVNVGDEVEVLLERPRTRTARIVLSKEKADKMRVWDEISKAYEADEAVEGTIIARVKGGLAVDIGVKAFLPGSQVDLRPVRNLDERSSAEVPVQDHQVQQEARQHRALASRAAREPSAPKLKKRPSRTWQEGQIVEGVVKNLTDYGAFIDLGGIDGLLHITDMSWGRVNHPSELFQVGDEVKVKVLKFDADSERVSPRPQADPGRPVDRRRERYPIGTAVQGKVVSLKDYGAFIELEEGIEGLVHVSEMSWTKRSSTRRRCSTSATGRGGGARHRRREPAHLARHEADRAEPVEASRGEYPVGTVVEGQVRNITDFGVFVGLEEGIDGLVHISDISWTERIKHPSREVQEGRRGRGDGAQDRQGERALLARHQAAASPTSGRSCASRRASRA